MLALQRICSFLFSALLTFSSFAQKLPPIPVRCNLEEDMPPIKNQHNRLSCASFATFTVLEYEIKKKYGKRINLSEEFLHGQVVNVSTGESSVYDCFYSIISKGVLREQDWPYQFSYFPTGYPCERDTLGSQNTPAYCTKHFLPPPAVAKKKLEVQMDMRALLGLKKICRFIAERKSPVIIPVPNDIIDSGEKSGIMHVDTNTFVMTDTTSLHFIVVEGYDLALGVFYLRNSYGKTWGAAGKGILPFWVYNKISSHYAYTVTLENVKGLVKNEFYPNNQFAVQNLKGKVFWQDSTLKVELSGKGPKNVRNQYEIECILTTKPLSDTSKAFLPIQLTPEERLWSKDTVAKAVVTSIDVNNPYKLNSWNEKKPVTIRFPKNIIKAKNFQDALKNKNLKIFLQARIYWHTDNYDKENCQEIILPLDNYR